MYISKLTVGEPGEHDVFDPALFFTIQRNIGMDPYVRGAAIGFGSTSDAKDESLFMWANESDPGGRRRAEYAADRWGEREPGQTIVFLG